MAVRAKKDTIQLSKIRMLEDLRRRLAKEAERKRVTLNAEIVTRLEQSFEIEDRVSALRESFEKRVEDWRKMAEQHEEKGRQWEVRAREAIEKVKQETDSQVREIELEIEKLNASAAMVDVLLGGDEMKSKLLRMVALEMASWPDDWRTNPATWQGISERFKGAFANKGVA
jgi:hypothetical protein